MELAITVCILIFNIYDFFYVKHVLKNFTLLDYSKVGTNSLPRRRESLNNNGKWVGGSESQNSSKNSNGVGVGFVPKGVTKLNGNFISSEAQTTSNPRHFSTYGTQ